MMRAWKHTININEDLADESLPKRERAAATIEALENAKRRFPPLLEELVEEMCDALGAGDWERFNVALEGV